MHPYDHAQPRAIESASATTSPANADSGAKPYLIAAAGLLALTLVASTLGGCVATTFKSLYFLVQDDVEQIDWEDYYEHLDEEDWDLEDPYELYEWLEHQRERQDGRA